MIKRFNKDVNPPQYEYVFDAKLVSINAKRKLVANNANKTKYFPAVVKGIYPSDPEAKADVFIWKNTQKEGQFEEGDTVTLSTIADKDSEHYGRCWIELGGANKVNMDLLLKGEAIEETLSKKERKALKKAKKLAEV